MTERFDWPADATVPSRDAVFALQGIECGDAVPLRIVGLFYEALQRYQELAEPRAIVADIDGGEFAPVFGGGGQNDPDAVVAAIYPKADRLALVAGTVGAPVCDTIRGLFHEHELALACMLDSVASAATDRLSDLAADRYSAAARLDDECRVLAYSPGYCGWHVTGQRALFAYLRPEQIGITLNASCLMQPLKSISGVLVAGKPEIHRFRPAFAFCGACRDKPCHERMARL